MEHEQALELISLVIIGLGGLMVLGWFLFKD